MVEMCKSKQTKFYQIYCANWDCLFRLGHHLLGITLCSNVMHCDHSHRWRPQAVPTIFSRLWLNIPFCIHLKMSDMEGPEWGIKGSLHHHLNISFEHSGFVNLEVFQHSSKIYTDSQTHPSTLNIWHLIFNIFCCNKKPCSFLQFSPIELGCYWRLTKKSMVVSGFPNRW